MHRIRATLRKALNDAIRRHRYIDINPAAHVELPAAGRPSRWSGPTERVAPGATPAKPIPVMVWTPDQTGAFLDHAHDAGDRCTPSTTSSPTRGLRRGEACGLHWADLDLDAADITVRWQIPNTAGRPHSTPPRPTTAKPPSPSTPPPSPSCAPTAPGNTANDWPPAPPGPTPAWSSPPRPADHYTPPTSPTTSATSSPRPGYHRSGSTTCDTAPPPSPSPPAST